MANPAGFRTVSTVIPDVMFTRLSEYLAVNGGSTSGFIKNAINAQLEGFNPETKSELQLALDDVKRMVDRYRKLFTKCVDLPPAKASEALALLEAELMAARPSFHAVAASDIKYEGLYKNMITGTRNKLRAAETKALTTPAVTASDTPAVRKLKDIPKYQDYAVDAASFYDVKPGELTVLGLPESLMESNLHVPAEKEWEILANVNWMRGNVCNRMNADPEWLPPMRSPIAEQGLAIVIERQRAAIAENSPKASQRSLDHLLKYQAHLATLPAPV